MSKPIETITVPGGKGVTLSAAIWENETTQDGRTFATHSVTIEKRYRDADGWKSSKSFKPSELLQVAYVAHRAYERALALRDVGGSPADDAPLATSRPR